MPDLAILAARCQQRDFRDRLPLDRIFVRDLVIPCAIGAYDEERGILQKVAFTVEAEVLPGVRAVGDDLSSVPSYDDIVTAIRAIVASGHIQLVETLAERIAQSCLSDPRLARVRVRVEKRERGPAGVGVEIVRRRLPAGAGEILNLRAGKAGE